MNKNKLIKITEKKQDSKSKIILELKIDKNFVNDTIDSFTNNFVKNKEIKGFRKGNAPKELIFKRYKNEILEESYIKIQRSVVDLIYDNDINPLRIIFNEQFLDKVNKDNDIHLTITCYIKPTLENFDINSIKVEKDLINKKFKKEEEKYKKDNNKEILKDLEDNKERYLENIYDNLIIEKILENIKISKNEIPEYLIEEHIQKSLDNVDEFAKSMGISTEEYFKRSKIDKEKLIKDLEKEVIDQLKLDIFTENIAKNNKIEVSREDINEQIQNMDKDEIKNINPEELVYNIRYYKSLKYAINLIKSKS
jgi:FKBP-type peptidyl-prolyl cis-trans isomerase (trigger factor)